MSLDYDERIPLFSLPMLMAGVWGFMDATFFFILPDVLLTILALKDPRTAYRAAFATMFGALLGGVIMYVWGMYDLVTLRHLLDYVPAVSSGGMEAVAQHLEAQGPLALFLGSFSGTFYKLYAAQAHSVGVDVLTFFLISIPARLLRFYVCIWGTHQVARLFMGNWTEQRQWRWLVGGWFLFYVFYFSTKAN